MKKQHATPCNTMQHRATPRNALQRKNSKKPTDTDTDTDLDTDTELRTDTELEVDEELNQNQNVKNSEREEKRESERKKHKIGKKSENQIAETMLEIWNAEVQSKLTRGHKAILTPKRKTQMLERWQEDFQADMKAWRYYCEIISQSEFCLGKVPGKGWTVDLSWAVTSSDHVAKILEGKFSGGSHPPPPPACNVPELQTAWEHVLACFTSKYGKAACRSWLSGCAISGVVLEQQNASVTLTCPNRFTQQWLEQHYQADLTLWWSEHSHQSRRISGVKLTLQGE